MYPKGMGKACQPIHTKNKIILKLPNAQSLLLMFSCQDIYLKFAFCLNLIKMLVFCRGRRPNFKFMGVSFKNISNTTSAGDCQNLCGKERNKCAGWNVNIITEECELFYVVEKCQSARDRMISGFCEGRI